MTLWDMRQQIEGSIPAWVILIPLGIALLLWVSLLFTGKK